MHKIINIHTKIYNKYIVKIYGVMMYYFKT